MEAFMLEAAIVQKIVNQLVHVGGRTIDPSGVVLSDGIKMC